MYGALKTVPVDEDPPLAESGVREATSSHPHCHEETMDDDEGDFAAGAGSTDAIVAAPRHDGGSPSHPMPKTSFRPFRSIRFYVVCQGLIQLSYLILGSYLKSVITSIEKRFGLDSKTAGFMSSGFEIGNLIVILPVSYFGRRIHRPRAIAVGVWFMIAGGMLLAVPHWLFEPYQPAGGGGGRSGARNYSEDLCHPNATSMSSSTPEESSVLFDPFSTPETSQSGIWRLMFFARILVGIGAAPVQPYGNPSKLICCVLATFFSSIFHALFSLLLLS